MTGQFATNSQYMSTLANEHGFTNIESFNVQIPNGNETLTKKYALSTYSHPYKIVCIPQLEITESFQLLIEVLDSQHETIYIDPRKYTNIVYMNSDSKYYCVDIPYLDTKDSQLYIQITITGGTTNTLLFNVFQFTPPPIKIESLSNLADLKLNSLFTFGKYQVATETPTDITWRIMYQNDNYQIAMSEYILDILIFDADEPNNPNEGFHAGNNNWNVSNIAQFLNSDKESWYSPQHEYDCPPSASLRDTVIPYDNRPGFLYYFTDEEKSLLKDITINYVKSVYETTSPETYSWTGKVWLPTKANILLSSNAGFKEGDPFRVFSEYKETDVTKLRTLSRQCAQYNILAIKNHYHEGIPFSYYTSSTFYRKGYNNVWQVTAWGYASSTKAVNDLCSGIVPCICLPRK